ncbi:MAG TPA: hypothetical protein DCL43_15885 [Chitinophagaceae bacterium]|nr:hypothetical protein [Chitinophagaceae bacterium]HAN38750.1 hypothetical protein [Chitinophagaceae bacterium]
MIFTISNHQQPIYMSTTLAHILSIKGPQFNVIDKNASVKEALQLMTAENLSYLIIRDRENFVGIISERDYARKVVLQDKASISTKVTEIMSQNLPVLDANDTPDKCMKMLEFFKSRYALVYQEFVFIGVITVSDMVRYVLKQNNANALHHHAAAVSNGHQTNAFA